jgi:hypothetical protein
MPAQSAAPLVVPGLLLQHRDALHTVVAADHMVADHLAFFHVKNVLQAVVLALPGAVCSVTIGSGTVRSMG